MRPNQIFKVIILSTFWTMLFAGSVMASLEWTLDQEITLPASVRDLAEAPDGQRLYVLTTQGTILVLNNSRQVVTTIPGPFAADGLRMSSDGQKLFLSSQTQKTLQVISLTERIDIDLTGSPFKGEAEAAVAVVVFSDFQ